MLETLYSYDAYGRTTAAQVTSMQDSPIQSYSYDSLGRTSAVTSSYAENSQITQNYSYVVNGTNQTGRIDSVSFSKTASGITQSLLPTVSYDYDAKGNITHVYENEVLKIKYYYDALNRLIREDNSEIDKTVVYNYNRFGNLISKVEYALTFGSLGEAVNTIPYEYSGAYSPDAITKYNGEESPIIYDTLGNPYRYRGYSMTWVKGRQLSAVSDADTSITFKYNNNGIRTKKTVNGVDTEFTYVGDMLVSQKTGNEVINFAYTAGGAPYGFTFNGTSYFYLTNVQGDIIGIYDSNGNVVVEYTYDSWGKLISITGSLADTVGIKNPLRYRGYYYDTETNLYYLQSRYYDPETCRFINMDAYFIAGDYLVGKDMYAYCLNNPVMYVDPTGYEANYHPALLGLCEVILSIGIISTVFEASPKEGEKFSKTLVAKGVDSSELYDVCLELLYDCIDVSKGKTTAKAGEYLGIILDIAEIAGEGFGPLGNTLSVVVTVVDVGSDLIDPRLDGDEKIKSVALGAFDLVSGFTGAGLAGAMVFIAAPVGKTGAAIIGIITYGLWYLASKEFSDEISNY